MTDGSFLALMQALTRAIKPMKVAATGALYWRQVLEKTWLTSRSGALKGKFGYQCCHEIQQQQLLPPGHCAVISVARLVVCGNSQEQQPMSACLEENIWYQLMSNEDEFRQERGSDFDLYSGYSNTLVYMIKPLITTRELLMLYMLKPDPY